MEAPFVRKLPQNRTSRRSWNLLLEAAIDIIETEGYRALTTSKISSYSGLSKTNYAKFFSGTDALALVAMNEMVRTERVTREEYNVFKRFILGRKDT